jgi:thiol:disulfide interchange protein
MRDMDFGFKAALAILVGLGGMLGYRMLHPSTTFAADGMDPNWDATAQRCHDLSRPAVVLFTAQWCPGCRMLHESVLSRNDVQAELQGHYTFYAVDMTQPSPSVQARGHKFGVSSIPLLIRFDADGKETDRTHYLEPAQMIAWLKAGE